MRGQTGGGSPARGPTPQLICRHRRSQLVPLLPARPAHQRMSTTLTSVASTADEGDAPPAPIPPKRYMARTPPLEPPASLPVWPRTRRRERGCAVRWLPLRLLLPGLSGLRALPRAPGRARRSGRNRHFPDANRPREAYRGYGRCALLALHQQGLPLYTDCCRTPIGNTAGPRFPVVGLIHSFMTPG